MVAIFGLLFILLKDKGVEYLVPITQVPVAISVHVIGIKLQKLTYFSFYLSIFLFEVTAKD